MQMVTSIKENGQVIWLMDMERLWMEMVLDMLGSGSMIFSMVKEKKVGAMERLDILVHFIKGRKSG